MIASDMQIGILSDIHDHVWNLSAALPVLADCDALLCCGDLCSPFVIHQLGRGFAGPIHIVFGNNDADLYRITANARHYPHVSLHGEIFKGEFDGRRVVMNHFDAIAREFARGGGAWDLVCFGHNHTLEIAAEGATLLVNPGAVMGAVIEPGGGWRAVAPSVAVYDTAAHAATPRHWNAQ
jgi:uncharacterized protein